MHQDGVQNWTQTNDMEGFFMVYPTPFSYGFPGVDVPITMAGGEEASGEVARGEAAGPPASGEAATSGWAAELQEYAMKGSNPRRETAAYWTTQGKYMQHIHVHTSSISWPMEKMSKIN